MKKIITIENKKIGLNQEAFTIAEIGSNHNRDKKTVFKLIDACAEAGFDCVKFQIYDPEEAFSKKETTKDVKLDHLYGLKPWWIVARDKILMPREWFEEMFEYIRKKKMIPLSAIHRVEDCEFLMKFGLPAIKLASIDLNYFQLQKKLLKFKLPIIFSTGMGTEKEIIQSVNFFKKNKKSDIALLHCNSYYPPKNNMVNLNNIKYFEKKFNMIVGYSDHTEDNYTAFASVVLGAKIIEKHITLDKKYKGADHPFAIEPKEMKDFIYGIRKIEETLGSEKRKLSKEEFKNRLMIRRSIVAKKDIIKGSVIKESDIKYARPGTGISITKSKTVINKIANKNIKSETIISQLMVKKK
jgi:N,N'-diacetyllegionaminate synthase